MKQCRPGAKTQMAVPYLAADTPNERAEFSHPDKAIVCTILAYFVKGLTLSQLHEMLAELDELAISKRNRVYRLRSSPCTLRVQNSRLFLLCWIVHGF